MAIKLTQYSPRITTEVQANEQGGTGNNEQFIATMKLGKKHSTIHRRSDWDRDRAQP